jgi:hypothetical protein
MTDKDIALFKELNSTFIVAIGLITPIVCVAISHAARKALFDYLNMEELYLKAKECTIGAAIVFLGICIVLNGLFSLFGSALLKVG